jgi:hypothetical protein
MNKPRFETLDGQTSNAKIAATAIALDVPLLADKPWTIAVGDGINGVRAIWNFHGASPDGNSIGAINTAWNDEKWLASNPKHEVTVIKKAFGELAKLADTARGIAHHYDQIQPRDTIYTASSAMAATMISLGHPCQGYTKGHDSIFWRFDRAAASDMALWADHDLHVKLPTIMISYVKCALLNWKILLDACRNPGITAVKHGTRTAFVGKNDDQKTQLLLEKLLYRK